MPQSPIDAQLVSHFYDFAGIDHISSPMLIPENKLLRSENFTSTGVVGGKTTREPYSLFLDKIDSNAVRNLIYFVYYNADGTSTGYVLRISGGNIYKYQVGVGSTWGTALTGFTMTDTTNTFAHATLANRLHLSNGTDDYQTWTPSGGFVASTTAPKVRTMIPYQRRIYGADVPGNASRVYFSSVDYTQAPNEASSDPWFSDNLNASTANYFDVDPEHNGAVIALDTVGNNLVMHKSSGGLYLYNGNSISNPLQSQNPFFNTPGESTTSPYAFDQISGIEFYMDRNAVYAYQGTYPQIISNEIYDYIQNMSGSQYSKVPAIAFKKKMYFAIGTTTDKYGHTITNAVLVYDFILNLWDVYSLQDMPTCWTVIVDANGDEQLLFGDSAGNVYQWNTGTTGDNGKPHQAILQTPYLTWGAPEITKDIIEYTCNTNPGANFLMQYATDWSDQWTTFNTTSGMGVSNTAPAGMRNFKSISFRLIANTTVPMTFYGWSFLVNFNNMRQSGRRI